MNWTEITSPEKEFLHAKTGKAAVASKSPEETFSVGLIIGQNLCAGDIIALVGELGAGKTCITQGIARGLGVRCEYPITSPSFTLINEYEGRHVMYHFDLYRLSRLQELDDTGCEEYLFGRGVSVIEWADKAEDILPEKTIFIRMDYAGENERMITISGDSKRTAVLAEKLKDGGF
ncbi:MAG TPA: tRNA (adenosine(37)-N6)-threonylcarbamoyltransferase complex ATPase subunit type 1 TsaE [Syntrophales bacterium]|nr:tRNA (adenosine(37)-N6)-threonylcarbamoyltransferase complex ATPase subunit type 1 TsaE [Syntrophales bacterium]